MTEPPPPPSEEATAALLDSTAKDPMGQHAGTAEGLEKLGEGLERRGEKGEEVVGDGGKGGGSKG